MARATFSSLSKAYPRKESIENLNTVRKLDGASAEYSRYLAVQRGCREQRPCGQVNTVVVKQQ